MKRLKNSIGGFRLLAVSILAGGLGILAGGLGTIYLEYGLFGFSRTNHRVSVPENFGVSEEIIEQRDWISDEFYEEPVSWCYLKVDQDGWSATPINNLLQLKERTKTTDIELLIPIFPTVYMPRNCDKLYYDTVLESDIGPGDKVLVIGSGSGSDTWITWLKSRSRVYVIEINPMAIVNINTTARLGDFQVKAMLGDIRDVTLPKDFSDFDFVLWNMPYLYPEEKGEKLGGRNFHDGDDGSILKSFLTLLPSLLKKDGQVIIINTAAASKFIKFPNLTTKEAGGDVLVYTFSNNAD